MLRKLDEELLTSTTVVETAGQNNRQANQCLFYIWAVLPMQATTKLIEIKRQIRLVRQSAKLFKRGTYDMATGPLTPTVRTRITDASGGSVVQVCHAISSQGVLLFFSYTLSRWCWECMTAFTVNAVTYNSACTPLNFRQVRGRRRWHPAPLRFGTTTTINMGLLYASSEGACPIP